MAGSTTPAAVELKIPSRPEYVGVARLTMLGVASRMQFSYDQVEDVRLAVGEACTTAVERAIRNKKTDTEITIRSAIQDGKLTVEVQDEVGPAPPVGETQFEDTDEQSLGALLMELLVDEFHVESTEKGTLVKMVKYAG